MEELPLSLDTYKLQLQQVEAALTADATSEELLKLKQDLVEVIALTNELISAQRETEDDSKNKSGERGSHKRNIQWSIGDKCMVGIILDLLARYLHYILIFVFQAPWSNNGQYYDCTIEALSADGEVSIRFDAYGNSDVTTTDKLKERPRGLEGGMSDKSLAEKLKTKYVYDHCCLDIFIMF